MLRVNLSSGETRSYDLEDEDERAAWSRFQATDVHQTQIRGITIAVTDDAGTEVVFAFPNPKTPVIWEAGLTSHKGEVVAEYITAFADRLAITMYVHRRTPLTSRVLIERVGKLRIRSPLREV